MTEPDWQFLGRRINELQADLRTLRSENAQIRRALSHAVTHEDLVAISDRIGQFEAHLETRLDQSERSIEERLTRIEELLKPSP